MRTLSAARGHIGRDTLSAGVEASAERFRDAGVGGLFPWR